MLHTNPITNETEFTNIVRKCNNNLVVLSDSITCDECHNDDTKLGLRFGANQILCDKCIINNLVRLIKQC